MGDNELAHIAEGTAVHDGEVRRLYDPADEASVEAVMFRRCVTYSFGVLTVTACIDTDGPTVTITVTLGGFPLGSCTLTLDKPSCKIGGSANNFTAEVTATLDQNPWAVTLSGKLCVYKICKSFTVTIPFG